MAKCEFHDESFRAIHETMTEIKGSLKNGTDEFRELEKSKLSWKVFTWIIGILMATWLAVNGVIWDNVKSQGKVLIHLDKKLSLHVGEKPHDINNDNR